MQEVTDSVSDSAGEGTVKTSNLFVTCLENVCIVHFVLIFSIHVDEICISSSSQAIKMLLFTTDTEFFIFITETKTNKIDVLKLLNTVRCLH